MFALLGKDHPVHDNGRATVGTSVGACVAALVPSLALDCHSATQMQRKHKCAPAVPGASLLRVSVRRFTLTRAGAKRQPKNQRRVLALRLVPRDHCLHAMQARAHVSAA